MKSITVSAPGKLMLFGEHAVVYNKPSIVTAVNQRISIIAKVNEEPVFKLNAPDVDINNYSKLMTHLGEGEAPKGAKFVEFATRNFFKKYESDIPKHSGIKFETIAQFKSTFGFGSSSASAVCTVKALAEIFKPSLTEKEIFDLAYQTVLDVQGVGSGDSWTKLSEEIAVKTGMPISLQEDPFLPTDAMPVYMGQVPSISFFTGAHAEYHSPRDTENLINYEGLKRTIEVIKNYTQTLVATSQKVVNYKSAESKDMNRGSNRQFRLYLGTIPDYSQEGVKGVRISGVSKDSPADKAGLKEKDIIVEFAGAKIENIYDYVYSLQTAKPSVETVIKVKRGDATESLKIVPSTKE